MRQSSSHRQHQIINTLIVVTIIIFITVFAIVSNNQRRDNNINNDTSDGITTVPGNGTTMIRGTLRPSSVAPTTAPSSAQQSMTIISVSDGSGNNMTMIDNNPPELPPLESSEFTPTETKAPIGAPTSSNEEAGEAMPRPIGMGMSSQPLTATTTTTTTTSSPSHTIISLLPSLSPSTITPTSSTTTLTNNPTPHSSVSPSMDDQLLSTHTPTYIPSYQPTTSSLSNDPSQHPSTTTHTNDPSQHPSITMSNVPSYQPTSSSPTNDQSQHPSSSTLPTVSPTDMPSSSTAPKTNSPSRRPTTNVPTSYPTSRPSTPPTEYPTSRKPSIHPTNPPSDAPTLYPTQEPTTPSPLAMSPFAYNDNDGSITTVTSCTSSQIHLRIELVTDNYPQDTSWQFIDKTNNVILLSSPIVGYYGKELGNGKMESQSDIRDICLGGDSSSTSTSRSTTTGPTKREYEFILHDTYGDGLCCIPNTTEFGYYKIYRKRENGNQKWQLLVAGSEFDTKVVIHHFIMYHAVGVTNPNLSGSSSSSSSSQNIGELVQASLVMEPIEYTSLVLTCLPPQRKITVQIKTDKNGGVISWTFRIKGGPIIAKNEKTYQSYEVDERDICVDDASLYELSVYDDDNDGMHAFNRAKGPDGHYKILAHRNGGGSGGGWNTDLMRETILYGGYFKSNNITHLINTTLPTMTARDVSWLDSHNKRRKYWHPYYNTTYVPLQWSESLKAEAQVWADTLLDACGDGMYHDPERDYGENAAANVGAGSWGELRVPDKIVARFIDREVDLPWPHNGHLTQALWRASHYVGCADSHKLMDDAGVRQCHTQVCRYARTGNCNMGAFKDAAGEIDWLTPTLEDENYCSDICPIDGCRA